MSVRKATAKTTRAPQPQLDRKIYRWLLAGRPDKRALSVSTRIRIFVLEDVPVWRWACSRGPNYRDGRCGIFWDAILRKVEESEIEIIDDVDHKIDDPPLITEAEAMGEAAKVRLTVPNGISNRLGEMNPKTWQRQTVKKQSLVRCSE